MQHIDRSASDFDYLAGCGSAGWPQFFLSQFI